MGVIIGSKGAAAPPGILGRLGGLDLGWSVFYSGLASGHGILIIGRDDSTAKDYSELSDWVDMAEIIIVDDQIQQHYFSSDYIWRVQFCLWG